MIIKKEIIIRWRDFLLVNKYVESNEKIFFKN